MDTVRDARRGSLSRNPRCSLELCIRQSLLQILFLTVGYENKEGRKHTKIQIYVEVWGRPVPQGPGKYQCILEDAGGVDEEPFAQVLEKKAAL